MNIKDHETQVFQFEAITNTEATFSHSPILGMVKRVQVPLAELYKWKATRSNMPHQMDPTIVKTLLYQANTSAQEECARMEVVQAIHHAIQQYQITEGQVCFAINPQGLYAIQEIKKAKALRLVPIGQVSKLKPKQESKAEITHKGHRFGVANWKQYTKPDDQPNGHLDPFWWVKATTEPDDVNMELTTIAQDGIQIPILQNLRAIKAKEQLLFLKPSQDEAAPSGEAPKAKAATKKRKAT